jgi:hypothetical protein
VRLFIEQSVQTARAATTRTCATTMVAMEHKQEEL